MVSNNAYITVGDPYPKFNENPFRAGKKGEKLTPFRTKIIPQNAENGNFAKLTYVPEGYKDGAKYKDTQPLDQRKKGFGSHDATRRDEFSNVIATECYRETLRKEKLLSSEKPEEIEAKLQTLLADRTLNGTMNSSKREFRTQQVHQFDIGRTRTTDFDPKSTKDSFYRFDQDNGKEFGSSLKPVSADIGESAWAVTYKPPSHGGKSEVKNFYDKSHLNVSSY
eukprot:gene6210-6683_t